MSAPALIRKDDMVRIMGGARDAGFTRVRVRIDPGGAIVVDAWDGNAPADDAPPANPLDRLLGKQ